MPKPARQDPKRAASPPPWLDVIARYAEALGARDSARMHALRAPGFVLDFVHGDASDSDPLSSGATEQFWPAWFSGFPEMDFHITRTISAEQVVVIQWTFRGIHSGTLEPSVFGRRIPPTGRAVRLRGVSVFDVRDDLIQRETLYVDHATLWVELGVEL